MLVWLDYTACEPSLGICKITRTNDRPLSRHSTTTPPAVPGWSLQHLCLGELRLKLLLQRPEPAGKGRLVLILRLGPHFAARGQDKAVGPKFLVAGGFGKAGNVGISLAQTPSMIGFGNLADVGIGKIFPGAVHQEAQFAGVDEQHLAAPVPQFAVLREAVRLVTRQKPQAGRDLRGIDQLLRQGDHAIRHLALDHRARHILRQSEATRHGPIRPSRRQAPSEPNLWSQACWQA